MIKRGFYLNQIIRHMHNGEIKVITGIHRCGKSVLLFELFRPSGELFPDNVSFVQGYC